MLFLNGSVIHGSPPNTSRQRFRRALICHYVPLSTRELARYYPQSLRFDGRQIDFADSLGGGPCGSLEAPSSPH